MVLLFPFKQFSSAVFGICNMRIADKNRQSYQVQSCFAENLRDVKVALQYRVGNSCDLVITSF